MEPIIKTGFLPTLSLKFPQNSIETANESINPLNVNCICVESARKNLPISGRAGKYKSVEIGGKELIKTKNISKKINLNENEDLFAGDFSVWLSNIF